MPDALIDDTVTTRRHALFAFGPRLAARGAVDGLLAGGLPAQAIWLHTNEGDPSDDFGGDLAQWLNSAHLQRFSQSLRAAFERHVSSPEAAMFASVVQHGGAVVSVDVASPMQRDSADRAMDAAGCERRTAWCETPARPVARNESPLFSAG